ncbi:hypothetical protein [Sorangium sp. So ce1024]|uniref:hypothetical protein n=1 Tax=unclassified Sorangium TaxID=2621164 RepID=UPI003F048861
MSATSVRNTGTGPAAPRRPRALALACLAATAAALLSPGRAGAAPPRAAVQLELRRAPGTERCPGEELLREELTRQLGYDPVEPTAALQARTLLFRGPGREVHATMEIHDEDGAVTWSRHLIAYNDDCRELVMNMALSLRVALDPNLRVQPARAPGPRAQPPPAPEPRLEPAAEPPAGPQLRAGLALTSVFGLLEDTGPGTAVHVALHYPSFSLGLEGHVQWPASMKVDTGKVSTWLAAASVVPCSQGHHLFACAFVSLGAATTSTEDVAVNEDSALWLATGPRVGVGVPLGDRLVVQAYGDIVLRLSELRVETPTAVIWMPPAVGGLVGIRLDVGVTAARGAPARSARLDRGPWAPR